MPTIFVLLTRSSNFAGPQAQGVLDLVCDAWDTKFAILGVSRSPPRAKRGAALGGSAPPGLPSQARRRSVDDPPKPRRVPESYKRASQIHDRIWNGFWKPKCIQKPSKISPKTFKTSLKSRCSSPLSCWSHFVSNFPSFCSRPTHDFVLFIALPWGAAFFANLEKY